MLAPGFSLTAANRSPTPNKRAARLRRCSSPRKSRRARTPLPPPPRMPTHGVYPNARNLSPYYARFSRRVRFLRPPNGKRAE